MNLFRYFFALCFVVVIVSCNNNNGSIENKSTDKDSTVVEKSKNNKSIEELNNALSDDPNNADLYYQRSQAYLDAKFADDALYDINRALSLDSVNPDFLLFKSDLMFRRGKGIEAKSFIQKSIEYNPKHIESHLKLAEIQLYVKQYAESISSINNALKIDVYNAKCYFLKGLNYKYLGDTAKAVSSFQTAVEQNPEYYEAYLQLGVIYASVQDPLAVSYYNNAIKVKPNSVEALYNRSLFLQENGKEQEAIEGYRYINKIAPTYQPAYYNIGYVNLVYLQEYDSAITYFNKALKLNPAYYDAAYNIGYSYELKGDKNIAQQFYTKTLQLKPDHTLAAQGLGRVR